MNRKKFAASLLAVVSLIITGARAANAQDTGVEDAFFGKCSSEREGLYRDTISDGRSCIEISAECDCFRLSDGPNDGGYHLDCVWYGFTGRKCSARLSNKLSTDALSGETDGALLGE